MILNSKQIEAVNHFEGPMLVVAGAGSGKTSVVVCRVGALLKKDIPPEKILVLTFTNKACQSLLNRLSENVLVKTFHSLGVLLLRKYGEIVGYKKNFIVYDDRDSKDLLKKCAKIVGVDADIKEIKSAMGDFKNSGNKLDDKYLAVASLYEEKLKEYNAVDFDNILSLTLRLLEREPSIASTWSHVMVDEYQDTNNVQYKICKLLGGQNLFVVGDPDQSIYSWRGSKISNILDFERDFENAKVVKLEENYRSTNLILQAANELISRNQSNYQKSLWSSLGMGDKVKIRGFTTETEEGLFVVEEIMKQSTKNVAVIYRTNAQSRIVEDVCLKYKVAYTVVGSLSFYKRKEIKDILSFLTLMVSPLDFGFFSRVINLPKRGIGKVTLAKMEQKNGSILEKCRDVRGSKSKELSAFADLLEKGIELVKKATVREAIDYVLYDFGYLQYLKSTEDSQDRIANVEELRHKAIGIDSLVEFLEDLSLNEIKSNDGGIQLTTLHNTKGLEFDTCFILGMEEEILPHVNSLLEEERRLFYVGMTRAKRTLYLTYASFRYMWGRRQKQTISRFLEEIPKEYVDWELNVVRGMKLQHRLFGMGEVTKVYRTVMGLTYDVYFLDLGIEKSLVDRLERKFITPIPRQFRERSLWQNPI